MILWLQRRILTGLWRCAYFSYQFLEDMRPAGGFRNWHPSSYWKPGSHLKAATKNRKAHEASA